MGRGMISHTLIFLGTSSFFSTNADRFVDSVKAGQKPRKKLSARKKC